MEESAPAGQLPWLALGSRRQLPQRRLVERDRCEPTQCYFSFSVALTWLFPLSWQKLKLLLAYRAAKVIFVFNFGFSVYLPNSFVLNVPNVPPSMYQRKQERLNNWTGQYNADSCSRAPGKTFLLCLFANYSFRCFIKKRKTRRGSGTDASFNLQQPRYRHPSSLTHCSNFKYEKIQRLKSCFFQRIVVKLLLTSIQAEYCMFEWSIYLQIRALAWGIPQSIFIFLGLRDHWWKNPINLK